MTKPRAFTVRQLKRLAAEFEAWSIGYDRIHAAGWIHGSDSAGRFVRWLAKRRKHGSR